MKKLATWTHTFVCLASTEQSQVPDAQERASLQIAGLGEKRVSLLQFADVHDIYSELTYTYPKLYQSGGFELLRNI
jgi:cyanate lyase